MNIYDFCENDDEDDYYNMIDRGIEIVPHKSHNRYVIINLLRENSYSKTYSAIKIDFQESANKSEIGENIKGVENKKFMVKFYRKELIEEYFVNKLNITQAEKKYYYDDLLKEFKNSEENIDLINNSESIQKIYDIQINEKGVFVVTEFCETTLEEYLRKLRESIKSNKCAELKYRNIFIPILDLVDDLDYKVSFSALINSNDIYVNEFGEEISNSGSSNNKKQNSFIKITHPFFNQLETVFKILDNEHYPNFYPPQFIDQFKLDPQTGKVLMDCTDLSDALSLINHNFDTWALGYLLYEILYEIVPFKFENIEKAKFAFKKNKVNYKIKRNKYSLFITDVIKNSMKYEKRLNLKTVKKNLYKEALNDVKTFEAHNLNYLIDPDNYKENEEENIFIIEEKE